MAGLGRDWRVAHEHVCTLGRCHRRLRQHSLYRLNWTLQLVIALQEGAVTLRVLVHSRPVPRG